ncbi:S8 family serine peptidase, partial [Schumannella luteola]
MVAYVGPDPADATAKPAGSAVVAVVDTGCGSHPWLDPVVVTAFAAAGFTDAGNDPEARPDQLGPLDGMLDEGSGHGTFVAGLVHQSAPHAGIAPVRVAGSDGLWEEQDLVDTLTALVVQVEGGARLDVLNLSLGFYHETPEQNAFDITVAELLLRLRRAGVVVVCSAGNDSTDRPMFPAALGPWNPAPAGGTPWIDPGDGAPLVSVGALNPNGTV